MLIFSGFFLHDTSLTLFSWYLRVSMLLTFFSPPFFISFRHLFHHHWQIWLKFVALYINSYLWLVTIGCKFPFFLFVYFIDTLDFVYFMIYAANNNSNSNNLATGNCITATLKIPQEQSPMNRTNWKITFFLTISTILIQWISEDNLFY